MSPDPQKYKPTHACCIKWLNIGVSCCTARADQCGVPQVASVDSASNRMDAQPPAAFSREHLPCPSPTGPLTFLIAVTAGGSDLYSLPVLGEGGVAGLLPGLVVPGQQSLCLFSPEVLHLLRRRWGFQGRLTLLQSSFLCSSPGTGSKT